MISELNEQTSNLLCVNYLHLLRQTFTIISSNKIFVRRFRTSEKHLSFTETWLAIDERRKTVKIPIKLENILPALETYIDETELAKNYHAINTLLNLKLSPLLLLFCVTVGISPFLAFYVIPLVHPPFRPVRIVPRPCRPSVDDLHGAFLLQVCVQSWM